MEYDWPSEREIYETKAQEYGLIFADVTKAQVEPAVLAKVPANLARQHNVLPLRFDEERQVLWVALTDLGDKSAADALRLAVGCNIRPVLAGPNALRAAILLAYGEGS